MSARLRYVIFGPGRVGRNMAAYLESLGHAVRLVSRLEAESEPAACREEVETADVVAAALPDSALNAWAQEWKPVLGARRAIHFSGALLIDGVWSFHPLYSFPKTILPYEVMSAIAFAQQPDAPAWAELFPGAPNPVFTVAENDRAYYHALAVLSGNFAAFLWTEAAKGFADRLGVPPETALAGYLSGVVDRFRENPADSMTGPLARRDRGTVEANLAALRDEPRLEALYRSFLANAWPEFDR